MKNTQISMVEKIHENNTNFNGWEITKTSLVEKIHGKKPTVREKIKFTNLTARCKPRHSTLSSWDKIY